MVLPVAPTPSEHTNRDLTPEEDQDVREEHLALRGKIKVTLQGWELVEPSEGATNPWFRK